MRVHKSDGSVTTSTETDSDSVLTIPRGGIAMRATRDDRNNRDNCAASAYYGMDG